MYFRTLVEPLCVEIEIELMGSEGEHCGTLLLINS